MPFVFPFQLLPSFEQRIFHLHQLSKGSLSLFTCANIVYFGHQMFLANVFKTLSWSIVEVTKLNPSVGVFCVMLGTKITFLLCPAGDCVITWLTISPVVFLVDCFNLNFCKFSILISNGINAKNAFFSANERSEGEGKGKEEEGKGEREIEIFLHPFQKVIILSNKLYLPPPPKKKKIQTQAETVYHF